MSTPAVERDSENSPKPGEAPKQKQARLENASLLPENQRLSNSMVIAGQISNEPTRQALFYLRQQQMSIPDQYPDLIANSKQLNQARENALEFTNPQIPHILALLNPQQHSGIFPLSAGFVSKFTLESLPEQVAIIWCMCSLLQWMNTGSTENYHTMPDWMRPGATQIAITHPIWVDILPWPQLRDTLCRNTKYHNEAFIQRFNKTLSINWPYKPEDVLIQITSKFAINPVFVTHLQNLDNWTVGPEFIEVYPELVNEVQIRKDPTVE